MESFRIDGFVLDNWRNRTVKIIDTSLSISLRLADVSRNVSIDDEIDISLWLSLKIGSTRFRQSRVISSLFFLFLTLSTLFSGK